MTTATPPLMVEARRILLDALDALKNHRDSLVLVGAQAVYLRTDEVELSFSASFTTDADVVVNPETLDAIPPLEEAMAAAGFRLVQPDRPGIWGKDVTVDGKDTLLPVDLIVPESLAGPGRRGARLRGHDKRAAGRATGLEGVVVDRSPLTIRALDPSDPRSVSLNIAGRTALLVSKTHKLSDRVLNVEQ